jgi:hypothetical protein
MGIHSVSHTEHTEPETSAAAAKRKREDEGDTTRETKKQKTEKEAQEKTNEAYAGPSNMRFNDKAFAKGMVPDSSDKGEHFLLSGNRIGTYKGYVPPKKPGEEGKYEFETTSGEKLQLSKEDIHGPRPTVGLRYPQGQPGNQVEGKDEAHISVGAGSELNARRKQNPGSESERLGTTFDKNPESIYADYPQHAETAARHGYPILNDVDLTKPETYAHLKDLAPGADVHIHMPRVPRGTPGYSTHQLIGDFAKLPKNLGRDDLKLSVTVPAPSAYGPGKKGHATHNSIYGLHDGSALTGTGMKVSHNEDLPKGDARRLENYGYTHKQSTTDKSADVAGKRLRTYHLTPHNKGKEKA